jgi:chemotaxis protein MotB
MARKKKHEEHENHERWLVSYADFITLLFAFFVVMYALSSINEGKFRVLSQSLVSAFHAAPKSLEPVQVGQPITAPQTPFESVRPDPTTAQLIRVPVQQQRELRTAGGKASELQKDNMKRISQDKKEAQDVKKEKMKKISQNVQKALSQLIDKNQAKITQSDDRIEIEINSAVLFAAGSTHIQPEAVKVLTDVGGVLSQFENPIKVEGYTDSQPFRSSEFRSNWELSASRAASVVHLFDDVKVSPERMAAIGYGQYRPVADNNLPEGRARNRRVKVVILFEDMQSPGDETEKVAPELPQANIDLDAPPKVEQLITTREQKPMQTREDQMESVTNQLKSTDSLKKIEERVPAQQGPVKSR